MSWNPLDGFWRIFAPLFNPNPDASPVRLSSPAPIWDLPSVYGKIEHPDNQDNIPHYAPTGYFDKLAMEPEYPIIHHDPPLWMTMANLGTTDWLVRIPFMTATGPAFAYGLSAFHKYPRPAALPLTIVTFTGFLTGIAWVHTESESRLQGFLENSDDVAYWTRRAEIQKKITAGEMSLEDDMGFIQKRIHALFGPKLHDLKLAEEKYYNNK